MATDDRVQINLMVENGLEPPDRLRQEEELGAMLERHGIRGDPGAPEGDATVEVRRDVRTGEFVREIRVNPRDVGKTAEIEEFMRQLGITAERVAQGVEGFGVSIAQVGNAMRKFAMAHGQTMAQLMAEKEAKLAEPPEPEGFMCKRKIRFTHRLQALATRCVNCDWLTKDWQARMAQCDRQGLTFSMKELNDKARTGGCKEFIKMRAESCLNCGFFGPNNAGKRRSLKGLDGAFCMHPGLNLQVTLSEIGTSPCKEWKPEAPHVCAYCSHAMRDREWWACGYLPRYKDRMVDHWDRYTLTDMLGMFCPSWALAVQALASLTKGEDWEKQFRREESRIESEYRTEVHGIFVEPLTPEQQVNIRDFFRHREQQLRAQVMGPDGVAEHERGTVTFDAKTVGLNPESPVIQIMRAVPGLTMTLEQLRQLYDGDELDEFTFREIFGWGEEK